MTHPASARSLAWVWLLALSLVAPASAGRGRAPRVGEPAPLFALPELQSGSDVNLEDRVEGRPLVLLFGSYT